MFTSVASFYSERIFLQVSLGMTAVEF